MPVLLMTGVVFGGGVDTAIAEVPMKAQRRLGLALTWQSTGSWSTRG
jgi:hypothetical protein